MTTLKQRFEKLASWKPEITQADLARAANVKPASVNDWFSGKTKSLKATTAVKVAAVYGCNAHWLATGEGEMLGKHYELIAEPGAYGSSSQNLIRESGNLEAAPALGKSRGVPVVGEVQAGDDGYMDELQYPVGHGEGFVEYWCKDDSAYALRVRGESMHPRYRHGEFIVVTPSIEAQPGRDVVVQFVDGRKMLKQLNWIRGGEVQLLSINNHFGPMTFKLTDIASIQRVAGSVGSDALI